MLYCESCLFILQYEKKRWNWIIPPSPPQKNKYRRPRFLLSLELGPPQFPRLLIDAKPLPATSLYLADGGMGGRVEPISKTGKKRGILFLLVFYALRELV